MHITAAWGAGRRRRLMRKLRAFPLLCRLNTSRLFHVVFRSFLLVSLATHPRTRYHCALSLNLETAVDRFPRAQPPDGQKHFRYGDQQW